MFDLDRAVRDWRHELSRHEAIGVEWLDELESHLLEEIDALLARGVQDEEAFHRSVRTLGPGEGFQAEIAKLDPDSVVRARCRWILIGFLIGPLILRGVDLAFSALASACLPAMPESWRAQSGAGVPWVGIPDIGILLVLLLIYWVGLRALVQSPAIRWLHGCARFARRPLWLATGVIALTVLCNGFRLLQSLWLGRTLSSEDFGQIVAMMTVPRVLAALLLPLLCIGFLRQLRSRDVATPPAVFWTTGGWLLLHVGQSLCVVVQRSLILAWTGLRPSSWQLGSRLYSGMYDYNEWDACFLFCPLAFLLAVLVMKGGSGLLKRPQALILWAIENPVVFAGLCILATLSNWLYTLVSHPFHSPEVLASVEIVNSNMMLGWQLVLPLVWGMSLLRLQHSSDKSAHSPAPAS